MFSWPGSEAVAAERDPRCAPLCGAVRAYGEQALAPGWWWKHTGLCPMRERLREEFIRFAVRENPDRVLALLRPELDLRKDVAGA